MLVELTVCSFALASLGAWIIAHFGGKLSLVDCPNERSSHCQPTPKGGGVGILAAFTLVGIVLDLSPWFWGIMGILSVMAGYGDRVELAPRLRLIVQLTLLAIFVLGTWQLSAIYYSSSALILFWIVFIAGTANYYNFMDGINGIAGITGVVGFSLLALYFYSQGDKTTLGALSVCMAFSCLGFLPFNMPKAKVFMGDIGSILLGEVFASLVYMASRTFLDFVCMASFLFPFYADELSTMVVRLRDGESLTKAHRRHVYQLLANEMQIPHWQVAVGYGIMQGVVGICVLLTKPFGVLAVLAVLASWFGLFLAGGYYIRSALERAGCRIGSSSV